MKNKKSLVIIAVLIAVILIIGLLIFKQNKKETDSSFYKTTEYTYTINGNDHKITFNYSTEVDTNGVFDTNANLIYMTVGIDGKTIESTKTLVDYVGENDDYKTSTIYENINLDNVKTIKGEDKDYIVILAEEKSYNEFPQVRPIVISEKAKVISKVELLANQSMQIVDSERKDFYYDSTNNIYNKSVVTEDAIYYLTQDCDKGIDEQGMGSAIEYKITIKNDKATETQVATYDVAVAGAVC